jgi:hypothetical protein
MDISKVAANTPLKRSAVNFTVDPAGLSGVSRPTLYLPLLMGQQVKQCVNLMGLYKAFTEKTWRCLRSIH